MCEFTSSYLLAGFGVLFVSAFLSGWGVGPVFSCYLSVGLSNPKSVNRGDASCWGLSSCWADAPSYPIPLSFLSFRICPHGRLPCFPSPVPFLTWAVVSSS